MHARILVTTFSASLSTTKDYWSGKMYESKSKNIVVLFVLLCLPIQLFAAVDWQELSLELTYGTKYNQYSNQIDPSSGFSRPDSDENGETELLILTIEYRNDWKYGETYLFVDAGFDRSNKSDVNIFSQGFESFSLGKIFKTDLSVGKDDWFLRDIRASVGWQYGNIDDFFAGAAGEDIFGPGSKVVFEASDVMDIFYGVDFLLGNFGWDGISRTGLGVGIYDDINSETDFENQWTVVLYGRANWYWGPTRWQYDGFIQWYDERDSSPSGLGTQAYIFSQHQIKLDAGLLLWGNPNVFYIGTEIQWTENTFGVKDIPDPSGFAPPGQSIAASTDELFATIMIEWVF